MSPSIEAFKSGLAGSTATRTSVWRHLPCFYLHVLHVFISFNDLLQALRSHLPWTILLSSEDLCIIGREEEEVMAQSVRPNYRRIQNLTTVRRHRTIAIAYDLHFTVAVVILILLQEK